MKRQILVALALAMFDSSWAQLNLPDMPGPPYPDKWGNNRWGVKYDPNVHGSGRNQQSAPSNAGHWRGAELPDELPPSSPERYRGGRAPQRGRWNSGLRPLVSSITNLAKSKRSRRPSTRSNKGPGGRLFDPTSDTFYKNPYNVGSIDNFVNNYMKTYNSVPQQPSSSSALVNIQNFIRPSSSSQQGKFMPSNFAMNGNRPSHLRRSDSPDKISSSSSGTSLSDSYIRTVRDSDTPRYRTFNPQIDFSGNANRRKSSKNFAKTLSSIYNDYRPDAENSDSDILFGSGSVSDVISSISSSSSEAPSSTSVGSPSDSFGNSLFVADDELDSYPPSPSSHFLPSSSPSLTGPPPSTGPIYVQRPYYSDVGPLVSSSPPSSISYSSKPLSALDLFAPSASMSSSGGGPYPEYSNSPMVISSSSGGGEPVTVTTYTMSGPPPSAHFSSALDSIGPRPYTTSTLSSSPTFASSSSFRAPSSSPSPILISGPPSYLPQFSSNMHYPPPPPRARHPSSFPRRNKKSKKTKRKKTNRLQHTPMNVLRGLFGRGDYHDRRDRTRIQGSYAAQVPQLSLPPVPPPQYSFNPVMNSLGGSGPDYIDGPGPFGPPPPPPQPPLSSPINSGLSSLRDSILRESLDMRERPPPPPPHYTGSSVVIGKENSPPKGPITQHLQDWPRIFTAMGSSVDAVAGGIHAVRKEISKVTGQAISKGIMMGGSAVHEASKGMAHMITKMSNM